ncbi:ABC transporter permease [Nocardiopsis sp. HNM0947]|uniref:ABC transporter permease n=1 Tax=Nocardiopsis coralli TaxID=2772213 RepID=A0ABR9P3M5_9ACTN|nr:ABC transporter permease [Nocardiopsis coralli]MBE2998449.1 ABC transporter permease [Nocardiopsis coralli]
MTIPSTPSPSAPSDAPDAPDTADTPGTAVAPDTPLAAVRARPGAGLSAALGVFVLLAGWALWPSLFSAHDPLTGDTAQVLVPPGTEHWFGTDHLGRDLHSRVVHGASLTLRATFLAVGLGALAGGALGLVSGFAGGRTDGFLMRCVDVVQAVPGLLLSMAVITVLGFGTVNVAVAVGVSFVAAFARVTRAEVLRVSTATYVEAARAGGVRWGGVLVRHVLPNSAGPVLSLAAVQFGQAVLAVSALSFLGFGAAPPAPEWGSLVAEGRDYMVTAWWLTTLPGLVVVATVLSTHRISRAFDPETRRPV